MDTHLGTNWRKEDASTMEAVSSTIDRQLLGSLMYLVNIRPAICFGFNNLSQFMVEP